MRGATVKKAGNVVGEDTNEWRIMSGNPVGNIPIGRCRHSWGNNIEMDPIEMDWDGKDIINLAKERDKCWIL